jgi:hypothetical protein
MKIKLPTLIIATWHKLKPIARHHYFIVMVILFGGVAFAVYTVNETLNAPTDDNYRTTQTNATIGSKFNKSTKTTTDQIKALQKSTDATSGEQPLPSGRINPFAE